MLELRFLGGIEIERAGTPVALPPSKKTRALLAYLAVSGKPHRRERICEMFWDLPDDPRGSLRWSLSKLRTVVDEAECPRIVADRDWIAFEPGDARIDMREIEERCAAPIDQAPLDGLKTAAAAFRGDFLEGTRSHELPGLPRLVRRRARTHARPTDPDPGGARAAAGSETRRRDRVWKGAGAASAARRGGASAARAAAAGFRPSVGSGAILQNPAGARSKRRGSASRRRSARPGARRVRRQFRSSPPHRRRSQPPRGSHLRHSRRTSGSASRRMACSLPSPRRAPVRRW